MKHTNESTQGAQGEALPEGYESWSEYFKRQRTILRLTQAEMAFLFGCGEKSYCRWENGSPPTAIVVRLLKAIMALKEILIHSYAGSVNGDCLHCGSINEIADHALPTLHNALPQIPNANEGPQGSQDNPKTKPASSGAEVEEIAREVLLKFGDRFPELGLGPANYREVKDIIASALRAHKASGEDAKRLDLLDRIQFAMSKDDQETFISWAGRPVYTKTVREGIDQIAALAHEQKGTVNRGNQPPTV